MLRLATTIAYALFILAMLAGCSRTDKNEPPDTNVKLGDLAPIRPIGPISSIKLVAFDLYTIELPAESTNRISDIWSMLYTKPVRLAAPSAFAENSFQVVFGEPQMWPRTAALLESAGAGLAGKTKLFLDYGQTDEFVITQINSEAHITYLTPDSAIESLTARPGRLVLRVMVSPAAAARGLCDFNAVPVLIPDVSHTPTDAPPKIEDVVFENLGFTVEISPGDFFLLGPVMYPASANSLGSLFFTTAKYKKIRVYAVFCSGIMD
jgi:hypothetical protein